MRLRGRGVWVGTRSSPRRTTAPTHIPGTADTAGLFSFDDLNRIIASQRLEPPRLRLSLDGEMVPLHRYAIPTTNRRAVSWSRIQPAEFHAQLKDGASLVLDSVEKIHPAVGAAAEGLERFLGTSVQANAYASWTDREGFGLHWDDHDVVVIQVHGSKRWRLYGSTREAPTFRDVESPETPEGDPVADIVLSRTCSTCREAGGTRSPQTRGRSPCT